MGIWSIDTKEAHHIMDNENVVAVWKNARMQLLMMMAERV